MRSETAILRGRWTEEDDSQHVFEGTGVLALVLHLEACRDATVAMATREAAPAV